MRWYFCIAQLSQCGINWHAGACGKKKKSCQVAFFLISSSYRVHFMAQRALQPVASWQAMCLVIMQAGLDTLLSTCRSAWQQRKAD